jgi:hypothetical protein
MAPAKKAPATAKKTSGPAGIFNSSLDGNTRRAIDFQEGDAVDGSALKALVRAAIAFNRQTR